MSAMGTDHTLFAKIEGHVVCFVQKGKWPHFRIGRSDDGSRGRVNGGQYSRPPGPVEPAEAR